MRFVLGLIFNHSCYGVCIIKPLIRFDIILPVLCPYDLKNYTDHYCCNAQNNSRLIFGFCALYGCNNAKDKSDDRNKKRKYYADNSAFCSFFLNGRTAIRTDIFAFLQLFTTFFAIQNTLLLYVLNVHIMYIFYNYSTENVQCQ